MSLLLALSGPCSRQLHSDVSLALGFISQEAVAANDARDLLLGAINHNAEITKRLGIGLAHKAPELGVVNGLLSLHGKVYDFEARGDCLAAYRGKLIGRSPEHGDADRNQPGMSV